MRTPSAVMTAITSEEYMNIINTLLQECERDRIDYMSIMPIINDPNLSPEAVCRKLLKFMYKPENQRINSNLAYNKEIKIPKYNIPGLKDYAAPNMLFSVHRQTGETTPIYQMPEAEIDARLQKTTCDSECQPRFTF
jgi:hypothetical protein